MNIASLVCCCLIALSAASSWGWMGIKTRPASARPGTAALSAETADSIKSKDRRMFDYGNRCFYFGYKETDTAFVGGEWTEIRVQDVPCYPYIRRTLQSPLASKAAVPEAPAVSAVPERAVQDAVAPPVSAALQEAP